MTQTVEIPELTEDRLIMALMDHRAGGRSSKPMLLAGARAKLRAEQIISDPHSSAYEVCEVRDGRAMAPDAWEIVGVPVRKTKGRKT